MSVDRASLLGPVLLGLEQKAGFGGVEITPADPVATQESTTSTSYTDLTTVGPSLTNLADGQYIVAFGAAAGNDTAGSGARMSVSVNGAAASDTNSMIVSGAASANIPGLYVFKVTLSAAAGGGTNSLAVKYRAGANTAIFQQRWLIVFRIANV